jgi:hypothetical protein
VEGGVCTPDEEDASMAAAGEEVVVAVAWCAREVVGVVGVDVLEPELVDVADVGTEDEDDVGEVCVGFIAGSWGSEVELGVLFNTSRLVLDARWSA